MNLQKYTITTISPDPENFTLALLVMLVTLQMSAPDQKTNYPNIEVFNFNVK